MKPTPNLSTSIGRILCAFQPQITTQKKRLIAGAVFILLATGMDVLQPWPLKFIYDQVFLGKSDNHPTVWRILQTSDPRLLLGILSLSFIGISVFGAAADYASTVLLSLAASNIIAEIRDRLFIHLEQLPLSFHSRHKTGDLITTSELGADVAGAVGDRNAAFMLHHGIVTCGGDVVSGVMAAVLLERACRTNIRALAGGGPKSWSSDDEALSKREHCWPPALLRQAWDYLARRLEAEG